MKIMLDSGAFSVWNSGKTVDLQEYIQFCKGCKKADHFVNLDVIPDDKISVELAAEQGMANYKIIRKALPKHSFIPVVHQGENLQWIDRYEKLGVDYIGISPSNACSKEERRQWLLAVKKHLGKRKMKCHGFGVAALELLECFDWYSVDSTTWAMHAQVWQILLPKKDSKGKYDYTKPPLIVNFSPRSKKQETGGFGFFKDSLSDPLLGMHPNIRRQLMEYLAENGVPLGKYETRNVREGHKRVVGESWLNKEKKAVVLCVEPGAASDVNQRMLLNSRYYERVAEAFGVPNFYLSGMPNKARWMDEFKCVLVSFHNIPKGFEELL